MPPKQTIHYHNGDLPSGLDLGSFVAVDTEAMGLNPHRDRLCVVQLSAGDGVCHVVQIPPARPIHAPRLVALLTDPSVTKIFHFARFDVALLAHSFGITVSPIYCTKIASRLVRTYTDRHGLKDLCKDLLNVDLSKESQRSDWGAPELSKEQLTYAASDVLHLHRLKSVLDAMLAREGRTALCNDCFTAVQTVAQLDLLGFSSTFFDHN